MKKVLLLCPERPLSWKSLNEVIPAIEKCWKSTKLKPVSLRLSASGKNLLHAVSLAAKCDFVVFSGFTASPALFSDFIKICRRDFEVKSNFVFHLYGEPASACLDFEKIFPLLRQEDIFIASSSADEKTLKICYPEARSLTVPFPIRTQRQRSASRKQTFQGPVFLAYAGRISEQKNLHTLFAAFSLLKKNKAHKNLKLKLFGGPDSYGIPNMGIAPTDYKAHLEKLSKSLMIESDVIWMGNLEKKQLCKELYEKNHVFVSPSLHADENFGVSVFHSLESGAQCVLSAWGGHLDFKKFFKDQTRLVPVYKTDSGPALSPEDLSKSIETALRKSRNRRHSRHLAHYSIAACANRLEKIGFLKNSPTTKPLRKSMLLKKLHSRGLKGRQIFLGYSDSLATPFLTSYGMRKKLSKRLAQQP